jgi:A/G-specific adenine glycosylase
MAKQFHIPPATVNAFRRALPRWYRTHKRALPWRATRDPYKIWVSEIMLQQTRVETVRDYYRRWLTAFPTVESLARAPYQRVLKLWEGLGYYSRAKNLHRTARLLCQSKFRFSKRRSSPRKTELEKLPGIGRYTAGAIASIAFGERAAVVDGNVARVFARVFGIRANVKLPATQDRLWALAEELLPARACGDFNQALMELGALVCLPAHPRCTGCPLRRVCIAPTDELPNRGPKRRRQPVTHDVVLVGRAGKVLLRQRPATGLLAGLWELPPREGDAGRLVLTLRHTITHRRITLRVFAGGDVNRQACRWVAEWRRLALAAAHRRALEQLSEGRALRDR